MIETIGDITTIDDFWDCECEQNFIHSVKHKTCSICNRDQVDQPNSRLNEVVKWALDHGKSKVLIENLEITRYIRKHLKLPDDFSLTLATLEQYIATIQTG